MSCHHCDCCGCCGPQCLAEKAVRLVSKLAGMFGRFEMRAAKAPVDLGGLKQYEVPAGTLFSIAIESQQELPRDIKEGDIGDLVIHEQSSDGSRRAIKYEGLKVVKAEGRFLECVREDK